MGIRDKPIAPGSPWQNGFAERLIGSIRRECVDHVVVLGEAHLRRMLMKYAAYYNELRTHRSLGKDVAQTILMLLEAVRAHASIALWPTGEQALANCLRLVDLARRFEHVASSFRAFVEQVERDAESGEASEAPIVEDGTGSPSDDGPQGQRP
jgi:hypothetical protein